MTEEEKLPEGQSQQPPYGPIPAYYLQGEQDDQVDWAAYIRVLWRRKVLILLGTLLCASTAFVVTVMGPPVYQTRATLLLQPPLFPTELTSAPLSVETLITMLQSDSVASKIRIRLLEKNVIQPDTPIEQIKDMLSVEIPAEKEPLIDLVVEADSPEKAEIVANTWAEIFVVESASLTHSGHQATLDFIESQYPVVKNTLMDRQAELKEAQGDHDQALLEHEKETERLRLEFNNRWKLGLLKEELGVKESKLTEYKDDLLQTEFVIKTTRDTLTQIKKAIQSQPQYLVLSKAITDEALWDKLGDVQAGLPEELNRFKLRSELLNPTYQALLQRLTATQIEYDTLVPKSDHLRNELESNREAIDELQSLITQKEIELFALLKDREVELSRLGRERDFQVDELTREVDAARKVYEPVVNYWTIGLATVQEEPHLKIGALAVAPGRPMERRNNLSTMIALVVGFMFSVMLAVVLEYAQSISLTDSPEREIKVSSSRSPELKLDSSSTTRRKLAGR